MAKVLGISEMFPSRATPYVGTFVHNHCRAVTPFCEIRFLSPRFVSPILPRCSWLSRYRRMPPKENVGGIPTYHHSVLAFPWRFTILWQTLIAALFLVPVAVRLRRSYRYDIIHAHGILPSGLAAVVAGFLTGCPVVVTSRGSDANVYPRYRALRFLTRIVLSRASAVTAVSRALREKTIRFGADPAKSRFIPNGVETALFNPVERTRADGKAIVFVGRLFREKGIRELIDAFRRLAVEEPDVRLIFVGDGPMRREIERASADGPGRGRIEIVGFVDPASIPAYLRRADLLCLPSYHEGWPNVCLEALACGLPIVGTNIEGLREIVTSDDLGILVRPGDTIALEHALREALRKIWNRERLVTHARAFSWEAVGGSYREVYDAVLRSRKESAI